MSNHPLDCLEPTDRPLLDLIFDRVDDSMLAEIAICDYGDDVAIHLAALHQIRANNIPTLMHWHPREVLELTRWTEWDRVSPQDAAMLLLCISLDRCEPELISFLMSMAYCNSEYIPISREIDNCQRSQKWRDMIDGILIDPMAPDYARSNPELQSLGLKLMGRWETQKHDEKTHSIHNPLPPQIPYQPRHKLNTHPHLRR